jgi:membrane protease YdiL (CAAX protease family)
MTPDATAQTSRHRISRALIEAVIAYAAFCGLSILSRFIPPAFLLVVVGGIAFPLLWAGRTRDWAAIGITRHKPVQTLLWGTGIGLAGMAYIYLSSRGDPPPMLGLQLALGIPLALLILSPFQELFFRGWLQPRFERAAGGWIGLFITAVTFAFWHLLPPFEGSPTSTVPVASLEGTLTTLGMGLAFGYAFQRTRSIVAPWLAHACMIVGLILGGAMTLVQYTP